MRKLKLLLLFLLFSIGVNADEQSTLIVQLHDGSSASFVLGEHPKITFSGEVMNIVSETTSMEFKRSDVQKYHFSNVPTSIEEVGEIPQAVLSGNTLVVSGVVAATPVLIYNASGIEVLSATAFNGRCIVSLDTLPFGLYIVTYNNTTFKFLKK